MHRIWQSAAVSFFTSIQQGLFMRSKESTPAKITREFSDDILANLYFDLLRLRDEVRKAEADPKRQSNYAGKRLSALARPRNQTEVDSRS